MARTGVFTTSVMNELRANALGRTAYGTYTKKLCNKESKIHLAIQDSLNTPTVRDGNERCICGGWTFSSIWGGDKVVCRHCGRQYFKREFDSLPKHELQPRQFHERRIFAMLLAGGDLREDKEKNVLILKDVNGIPEGELPLEFAEHLATVFKDAVVITAVRRDTIKAHNISLHMAAAEV